jgi:hypothetical protein
VEATQSHGVGRRLSRKLICDVVWVILYDRVAEAARTDRVVSATLRGARLVKAPGSDELVEVVDVDEVLAEWEDHLLRPLGWQQDEARERAVTARMIAEA